ncbi:glycoside hydrolase family 27 protein [bacterium]|nr:glycoside hydrolase family 27 protein [bacterium]
MKKALLFFLLLFVWFAEASDLTYEEFKDLMYVKAYLVDHSDFKDVVWSNFFVKAGVIETNKTHYLEIADQKIEELSPAEIWTYGMKFNEELSWKHMEWLMRSDQPAPHSSWRDFNASAIVNPLLRRTDGIGGPLFFWGYGGSEQFEAICFWYEWRKYLPKVWDMWYECWKEENKREKPRKAIVKILREDAGGLTYHFAPFIYKAIKEGDRSLEKNFASLWPKGQTNETLVFWWEREKDNYTLPPCEGYKAAKKRLEGKDLAYHPQVLKDAWNMCSRIEEYYENPACKTNYWYYFLKPDYEYDQEGDEYMLDRFRFSDLSKDDEWRKEKLKSSDKEEIKKQKALKKENAMDIDEFYDNTAASQPTPPMGWNSYCTMNCDPTEKDVLEIARCMADNGYLEAGYRYINIDDGWLEKERDEKGQLVARKDKFPHGMSFLTSRLHALGFKAGIYLGCGVTTWHGDAGSLGHEFEDARQIADWGFDYLKYDYHPAEGDPERNFIREYTKMGAALRASGRKIFYNLCEHGRSKPWLWAHGVGPMWRIGYDIRDQFDGNAGLWSVTDAMEKGMQPIADYARPGNYNDPDFLVCGMRHANDWMGPGCTDMEYRANFGLWCFTAAPLMIGGDPRKLDATAKVILTHKGYIALDQDPLCVQGRCYKKYGFDGKEYSVTNGYEVWRRELSSLRWAVALFNRSSEKKELSFTYRDIELEADWEAELTDLWSGESLGIITPKKPEETVYKTPVASHEFKILIMKPRFTKEN